MKRLIAILLATFVASAACAAPVSSTANANQSVTISVTADGTQPFTYQWRKLPLGSASGTTPTVLSYTGSSIALSAATARDSGIYTVVISNSAGSLTSDTATLTVNRIVQATLSVSSGATVQVGAAYTAVVAGGSGNGSIVWSLGAGSTAAGAAIDPTTGVVTFTGPGTVVLRATKSQDWTYNALTSNDFVLTVVAPVLPPSNSAVSITVR